MPAYNFTVFLDKVADGTKQCRKLTQGVVTAVKSVRIGEAGSLTIADELYTLVASDEFAHADGFESYDNFLDFFRSHYGLPFTGEVVMWEPDARPDAAGQEEGTG